MNYINYEGDQNWTKPFFCGRVCYTSWNIMGPLSDFMLLISFYISWKDQKTRDFFMFRRGYRETSSMKQVNVLSEAGHQRCSLKKGGRDCWVRVRGRNLTKSAKCDLLLTMPSRSIFVLKQVKSSSQTSRYQRVNHYNTIYINELI